MRATSASLGEETVGRNFACRDLPIMYIPECFRYLGRPLGLTDHLFGFVLYLESF